MTTGERIQKARKAAGLSQKELGKKLGVSASMIGQYENDLRIPKIETLEKISAALNVKISSLRDIHVFFFQDLFVSPEDDEIRKRILEALADLNAEGQQKAVERVEELTEIPKYKKEPPQD